MDGGEERREEEGRTEGRKEGRMEERVSKKEEADRVPVTIRPAARLAAFPACFFFIGTNEREGRKIFGSATCRASEPECGRKADSPG